MRTISHLAAVAALLGTLTVEPVLAQAAKSAPPAGPTESNPKAGHSSHGEAFDAGPRQTARLLPGMGTIAWLPVSTTRAETAEQTQAFVRQGVAQLHGFWYWEAERSFRTAAKADPDCAMAYWGMAMANVNNTKRARGFIAEAVKRRDKASPREQLWIAAAEDYFRETSDAKGRATKFFRAMEDIGHEHPDDIEATAFLAWAMWANNFSVPITSRQAVDRLIADVLRVSPEHPGAHHYRIHLWDDAKAARALLSAAAFGPSQPGIAHAWHMPGHIYDKLRRYADAATAQEMSARVDHHHMHEDVVMPYLIHNYAHNNQWLVTSLSHVGRVRDAEAVASSLIEVPRHPRGNRLADAGSCARFGRTRLVEVLSRYEMWDRLAAAAESLLDPTDQAELQVARLRALGAARIELGDWLGGWEVIRELESLGSSSKPSLLGQLNELLKPKPAEPGKPAEPSKPATPRGGRGGAAAKPGQSATAAADKATAELLGRLLAAMGDHDSALAWFKKAGDLRPEQMAYAHLRAGDKATAERLVKQATDNGREQLAPLAAYAEVLFAVGKRSESADALRKLAALTAHADGDLPVLARLAPIAAELKVALPVGTAARPNREAFGPLKWPPSTAPKWSLIDPATDSACGSSQLTGPVVLLFHLGPSCEHCVAQLRKFGPMTERYAAAGIRLLAISSDAARKPTAEAEKFPFPLLADPEHRVFRQFSAFDDFEGRPLHGTFLIDAAGRIRWKDVGPDPFDDAEFLLSEAGRLLGLK